MVEQAEIWKPTCNRFVAFLDIMGFREMVLRKSHEDVREMLESLYPTIEIMKEETTKRFKRDANKDKEHKPDVITGVLPILFSDSIIFVSSDDSSESAYEILLYSMWILNQAITDGIPMKGAIAHGEQTAYLEKSLCFGKPLIDAYELQQELQIYGVILHHTMEKHLIENNFIHSIEKDKYISKWDVPMKSGDITHYLVNWASESMTEKEVLDMITKLYVSVSGNPRLYVDNTLDFVHWVIEKKAEVKQAK